MCLLCIFLLIRSSHKSYVLRHIRLQSFCMNVNLSKTNFGQFFFDFLTIRIVHTHPRGFGKILTILNIYFSFIRAALADTDDVKQKTSLFPVQGKICLVLFPCFLFFCFISSVSGTRSHFPAAVRPATEQNYYGLDVSEGGNFKYSKELIFFCLACRILGTQGVTYNT